MRNLFQIAERGTEEQNLIAFNYLNYHRIDIILYYTTICNNNNHNNTKIITNKKNKNFFFQVINSIRKLRCRYEITLWI